METRSPVTLEEYRVRFARASSWALGQIEPACLTAEARQALFEEIARRGQEQPGSRPAIRFEPAAPEYIYRKAPLGERFGAYVVDSLIGIGPLITAGIFNFIFHITQNPLNQTINMIATVSWAIYYGATKDARGDGQSIGKKMFGLMVVGTKTNEPCTLGQSMGRALVRFLLGALPMVGQLIEPIALLANDDGRRIGDRAADTQVILASDYELRKS